MKKLNLSLVIIFTIMHAVVSQEITGTWYELSDQSRIFKLTIHKEQSNLKGSYDLSSQRFQIFNAPVDTIIQYDDSLIIEYTVSGMKVIALLKKDSENDLYMGELYFGHFGAYPIKLSREPVVSDIKIKSRPPDKFTKQDTLRGSITPERKWWDLIYYHLDIKLDAINKTIKGSNLILYKVLEPYTVMQIDLQPPLEIIAVEQNEKSLPFKREGNVYFIEITELQDKGTVHQIEVFYEGTPKEAPYPPWDGGITWSEDANGKPWIATSCQGEGASLWWPNKDHMYDEVDSMMISVNVPKNLTAVANGRLIAADKKKDKTKTYHWFVKNPINNYGVNINVADYAHFSENYSGEKGLLTCDYYVLPENLSKAEKQFRQVPLMLEAFEYWFGPYPFYEDGFKLVEVPYLGMEHQSSVTYGNQYENGYLGRDRSETGWGLKFDFIIIHESGHEWFANNITYKDIADIWIHEGFTNYSEGLYVEYHYGKDAGQEYIIGNRKGIGNEKPLIANYEVNDLNYTVDVYNKGANILHTLRQIINDDEKWRKILRGLNEEFYHKTVTTYDVEHYISDQAGIDLQPFFDQYLRNKYIPTLEYYFTEEKMVYRWINVIPEFDMPLKIYLDGSEKWIYPKTIWTHDYKDAKGKDLSIDPNFYAASFHSVKD